LAFNIFNFFATEAFGILVFHIKHSVQISCWSNSRHRTQSKVDEWNYHSCETRQDVCLGEFFC